MDIRFEWLALQNEANMKRKIIRTALAFALSFITTQLPAAPAPVTADEAKEIAVSAYIYAYPLVLMDVTRKVQSNSEVSDTKTKHAPINQFYHAPEFPDATFTDVVRANADTLYSFLWFDVTREPLMLDVPDSGGRYYLLPMLDMWTDIFASPGNARLERNRRFMPSPVRDGRARCRKA